MVEMDLDDEAALPRLQKAQILTPEGKPVILNAGSAWPMAPDMTIVAMFKDEDEIRVYALPAKESTPQNKLVPCRYSCSRKGVGILMETMVPDTFKHLVATELASLDEETWGEDDEEEEETTPAANGATVETKPPPTEPANV